MQFFPSVQPDRRKTVGPQISDVHNHVNLRIRILEDPRINVLNVEVFQKYPLQELRCPSVLKEPEFLDLLRSTFPQLADDKPFDVLITDRSRKLRPLDVKTLTPQEISRTLGSIMNNHIYFRLKSQEEAQASAEKLHLLQRKVDEESPSTSGQSRLQTRVHRKTSQDIETGSGEEDSERERSPNVWNIQSLLLSDSEKEEESGEEVVDGDDDWKPNRGVASLMNKEPEMAETSQQPKRSGVQANRLKLIRRMLTSNHDPLLSCKVCGAPRTSMNMLIKHSWSHVDDTEKLCGICGQNSDSADELRNHLQSHQKTRSCHICRKSFLTSQGLRGHIARHTGDKPHVCNVCHKAFPEKSALSIHMWTHSADKPHKCDVCQKSFLKKINLEHHRATHSAEKLYNCSVCMKTFKSHEHVSQHMLIHSSRPVRESKYTCEICSKRFYTNQKLQFHLSSHTSELRSHRHSTPRRNPPAAWPSVRASL
uniref:C2H2-type domain-containing protein n=1 Tax=Lates calcarifer TaxID=8187 RepID=A0A4W6ESJ8_LATCA